jgi:hypothetical protein
VSELGESIELATELALETVKEDGSEGGRPRWYMYVALSTLLMALLTAIGALLAGVTSDEALLKRTEEIMEISILEGDRVQVDILSAKHEILVSLGKTPDEAEVERVREFKDAIEELAADVQREEKRIISSNSSSLVLAVAVTLLSVGITVSGMSVIVEQKMLWIVGIVFGVAGAVGVGIGVVTMVT